MEAPNVAGIWIISSAIPDNLNTSEEEGTGCSQSKTEESFN